MDKLRFGVAYYDEYMPYERLEEDIRLMKESGINTVRIAESTWSTHEPKPGVFNFSSVDKVLDAMYKADIDVIIGTPTYAIPSWMVEKHPEVLAYTQDGKGEYGRRQNMDITHPTFLFYAERIIKSLISHVSNHPAVIGYQIDNETKHYGTLGPNVQHEFVKYLKDEFENLEELNKKFGLNYWSNRVNDWEDFPSTIGTINGSLGSVFAKFQRKLVTNFLNWQIDIVKELKKDNQFITHNFDFEWRNYSYGLQPDVDHFEASKNFDYTGVDIYHPSQHELTGTEISFGGDVARSTKHKNYLVLESQAQAFTHWTPYPNQLKLQAMSHLASGANMLAYWHWHSIHNSFETYWKGVLSHDFKPNYIFDEAKEIGKAFKTLSKDLTNASKNNKVAILVSNEALTSLDWFKLSMDSTINYNDILRRYYDSLYNLNVETDIISVSNLPDLKKYNLIVIPALYSVSNETIDIINHYIKTGGNVLYTFKGGFADENVQVRHDQNTNRVLESAGIHYNVFVKPFEVSLKGNIWEAPTDADVSEWMELIEAEDAEVLMYYDHPEWGNYSAITKNKYGEGIAYYVGCYLDHKSTQLIIEQILNELDLASEFKYQFPLIHKKLNTKENEAIHFFFNYSGKSHDFRLPFKKGKNLLTDEILNYKDSISIDKWQSIIVKMIN